MAVVNKNLNNQVYSLLQEQESFRNELKNNEDSIAELKR